LVFEGIKRTHVPEPRPKETMRRGTGDTNLSASTSASLSSDIGGKRSVNMPKKRGERAEGWKADVRKSRESGNKRKRNVSAKWMRIKYKNKG